MNLVNAVRTAAAAASRGLGVLVLLNDEIHAAREVTKTNTTRVETFQAPERGALAIVDPEGVFYHRAPFGRERPQFDVSALDQLPRVDVVYAYPGGDSVAIQALVAAGAKGLVVAGVGRGGTPREQRDALRRAREQGVVVVMSSRTGSGRVPVRGSDDDQGRVGAGDLNPQKARVLLALALTRTSDPKEIARIFEANQ
jgi:L-asparaginase